MLGLRSGAMCDSHPVSMKLPLTITLAPTLNIIIYLFRAVVIYEDHLAEEIELLLCGLIGAFRLDLGVAQFFIIR